MEKESYEEEVQPYLKTDYKPIIIIIINYTITLLSSMKRKQPQMLKSVL